MSLRARLAWTLALAIAIVAVVVATVSVVAIDRALRASLDARLATTARTVAALVDLRSGRLFLDQEDHQQMTSALTGVDGAISTCDGATFLATSSAVPPAVNALQTCSLDHRVQGATADGRALRIATAPIARGTGVFGVVVVWQPSDFINEFDRDAAIAVAIAALIAGAIVVVLSSELARRALAPLERFTTLATAIEERDLSRRVGDQGSDELGRLGSAFDRMLDRLEDAFKRQRRFAADASHELRAPLAVIRAEAEVTLARERSVEEYERALQTIVSEVERIDGLVDALLVAARADSGKLTFEPVDLDAVARMVEERFLAAAEGRGLTLAARLAPSTVSGDAGALERALSAIVHNAIDFARSSVIITLEEGASGARLTVADDGPGFSDEGLRHAADRFWRGDPVRTRSGTGLGLSIAEAVVRAHGGSIRWGNGAGGGAYVLISLRSS